VVVVHRTHGSYNYTELLLNSQFALCPRGNGYYSYRITEAMSAGAIPVILSDRYVLPFDDIVDWKAFSVIIPENRWENVVSVLHSFSAEDIAAMRACMDFVFHRYFASLALQMQTMLDIIRSRIYGVRGSYIFGSFRDLVSRPTSPCYRRTK